MDPSLAAMAQTLMERELSQNPDQFKPKTFNLGLNTGPESKPLSPSTVATLGGMADVAGTYYGMKRGVGSESNALVNMIGKQSPEKTAAALVGGVVLTKAATKLLRRLSPRAADIVAANLGAQQFSLGAGWFSRKPSDPENGFEKITRLLSQSRAQSASTR